MPTPPEVVVLRGEVGAGKTTLAEEGIAAALGAAAEGRRCRPATFTIVHEYERYGKVRLFHLDLYRLETEEQIAVLGLDEMAGYPTTRWCWWNGARRFEVRSEDGQRRDLHGARRGRRARNDRTRQRLKAKDEPRICTDERGLRTEGTRETTFPLARNPCLSVRIRG